MALPPVDPAQRQKLLLLAAMVLGLGYVFYSYVYSPKADELAVLEERLENVRMQNQRARSLAQGDGTGGVERRLVIYREQLQAVEGLIPSSEELPDLLDAISAEAQRTGVELTLIQPVGASAEAYYTRRVYDVAVVGTFHAIGEFLSRIGSLPRIVTPIDLTVTTPGGAGNDAVSGERNPRLEGRFSIETYVLTPLESGANAFNSD
jgi:type IV pilus assembly protein PilO